MSVLCTGALPPLTFIRALLYWMNKWTQAHAHTHTKQSDSLTLQSESDRVSIYRNCVKSIWFTPLCCFFLIAGGCKQRVKSAVSDFLREFRSQYRTFKIMLSWATNLKDYLLLIMNYTDSKQKPIYTLWNSHVLTLKSMCSFPCVQWKYHRPACLARPVTCMVSFVIGLPSKSLCVASL